MTRGRATVVLAISFSFSSPLLGQVLPFFTKTAQTVGFESNAFRTFSRGPVEEPTGDRRTGGR